MGAGDGKNARRATVQGDAPAGVTGAVHDD